MQITNSNHQIPSDSLINLWLPGLLMLKASTNPIIILIANTAKLYQ
jgi:hypothetical protein